MDANAVTLATVITGFLGTFLKMYYDSRTRAQNRRWDVEDRQRVADSVKSHNEAVAASLAENTTLTKVAAAKSEGAEKAAALAAEAANHVNQKLIEVRQDLLNGPRS